MRLGNNGTATVDIGKRIHGLCKAKSLRPSALARAASLQPSSLTRYAAGRDLDIKGSTLTALAAALDVSTDYLLGNRPDLDQASFEQVSILESFRIFEERTPLSRSQRQRYRSVAENPAAPRTLLAWQQLDRLLRAYLGRGPSGTERRESAPDHVLRAQQRFRRTITG